MPTHCITCNKPAGLGECYNCIAHAVLYVKMHDGNYCTTCKVKSGDGNCWTCTAHALFAIYRAPKHNWKTLAVYCLCKGALYLLSGEDLKYQDVENPINTECCICLEDFQAQDVVRHTKCNHTFHARCLKNWEQMSCPYCRTAIS